MVKGDEESCTKDKHDSPMPDDLVSMKAPSVDASNAPCISFHSLTRQLVPSTLKLSRTIHEQKVVVLIDGGSTNNFIQSCLATHLGLTIQPSQHLRVTVENGDFLNCVGASLEVPLMLNEILFPVVDASSYLRSRCDPWCKMDGEDRVNPV